MPRPPQEEFAAYVGIDWADTKHDICLQVAGSDTREYTIVEHTPETIDEWVNTLRQRFKGQPIAICLELNKGPLVTALRQYDCLVRFPVNPRTLARNREAFTPSHAKDDPTDAALSSNSCSSTAISSPPHPPNAPRCVPPRNSSNIAAASWATT